MIRIEVQQAPNSERVAWEADEPWDADVASAVIAGIEDTIKAADALGISLWDAMVPKASPAELDFQLMSMPKFQRCLTFKVRLVPPAS